MRAVLTELGFAHQLPMDSVSSIRMFVLRTGRNTALNNAHTGHKVISYKPAPRNRYHDCCIVGNNIWYTTRESRDKAKHRATAT